MAYFIAAWPHSVLFGYRNSIDHAVIGRSEQHDRFLIQVIGPRGRSILSMRDVLTRIKQLILLGRYKFTLKASEEMDSEFIDELRLSLVEESDMKTRNDKLVRKCPTCGACALRVVVGPFRARIAGRATIVPDLQREECSTCGEVLFGPAAMRRMEALRRQARPRRARQRSG